MIATVAFIASYIVSAAWQVPVLCIAGWICALLLRRLGPAAQHRMWMAVLLLCAVVPALPAPRVHGSGVSVAVTEANVNRATTVSQGSSNAWRVPLWVPVWLMEVAAGIWTLTAAYGGLRLLRAYRATERLVEGAEPLNEPSTVHDAIASCGQAMRLPEIQVMMTDSLAGPVTLRHKGIDVLLLPERLIGEVSQQDVYAAVAHECAHIARRDYSTHLLLQVAALPVRFHPLMEHVHRQIAATREMACDAAAASVQGPVYRDGLLRLAQWIAHTATIRPALAMGFAVGIFDSNSLESRMKRLTLPQSRMGRFTRTVLSAVTLAAMGTTASALTLHGMHLLPSTGTAPAVTSPVTPARSPAKTVMPELIYQVDPEFPGSEKGHGPTEHNCVVRLRVDTDGTPQDVHVVKTAGKAFDQNALAAVSQYRFKPATKNGQAVSAELTISVNFQLF